MNISATLFMISSILLAGIAGIVRYKHIETLYQPFIFYLWLGILNEFVSIASSYTIKSTVLNNNIFMLCECVLLCWQFKRWAKTDNSGNRFTIFMLLLSVVWMVEMAYSGLRANLFYFNMAYCFFLTMCAIQQVTYLLVSSRQLLFKNATFLICCGFIIYFSYRLFLEATWFYGLNVGADFRNRVYIIMIRINYFINLLYLYAILWIPRKPDYITL